MSKRMRLLVAIVALFGLVLAPSAVQAGSFQQNVSGGFTDTAIDTNADGMAANIMTGATIGTGGTASYDGVLEIKFEDTGLCAEGEIGGVVVAYSMVRRYGNGDLLFSRLVDGTTCFNPALRKATIDINAEIFGGTGTFAGASGAYSAHYDVAALLPDGHADWHTPRSSERQQEHSSDELELGHRDPVPKLHSKLEFEVQTC